MTTSNFLEPATDNPMRPQQAQLNYAPQVRIFESTNPNALQADINDYLASLAAPPQPVKYYLREIEYTSAQEKNNMVSYSALLHLEFWEQE
jgi:hypothetical protein